MGPSSLTLSTHIPEWFMKNRAPIGKTVCFNVDGLKMNYLVTYTHVEHNVFHNMLLALQTQN